MLPFWLDYLGRGGSMETDKTLRLLKDAQHDPAKLALVTIDFAYVELPAEQKAVLKATLEAVAIPHWCTANLLSVLLGITEKEASLRLEKLKNLTIIESFQARGNDAINVHEASRIALRSHLADQDEERFRALSTRATEYFSDDETPAGRIERVYHLLCSNPESGADELRRSTPDLVWKHIPRTY